MPKAGQHNQAPTAADYQHPALPTPRTYGAAAEIVSGEEQEGAGKGREKKGDTSLTNTRKAESQQRKGFTNGYLHCSQLLTLSPLTLINYSVSEVPGQRFRVDKIFVIQINIVLRPNWEKQNKCETYKKVFPIDIYKGFSKWMKKVLQKAIPGVIQNKR